MGYSIDDVNKIMTIFYSKMDGTIVNTAAGKETMFFFADREEEYSIIWDYVQLPYSEEVMQYPQFFKIVEGNVQLKSSNLFNRK